MLTMNSGQYPRKRQVDNSPLNLQCADEVSEESMQTTRQMAPFDGIPRSQSHQQFISAPDSIRATNDYSLTQITMPQPAFWSDPNTTQMTFSQSGANNSYGYSPNVLNDEQESNFLRGMDYSGVPRTWGSFNSRILDDTHNLASEAFEPSIYMIDPNKTDMQDRAPLELDRMDNPHSLSRMSLNRSPKIDNEAPPPTCEVSGFRNTTYPLPPSEYSEDGGSSREMTMVDADLDNQAADEPYAKLIHRALMSAPNHSMVLQEIYQWFRDNTIKGSSDTKGWMNSIRHNLSMNQAFKKTERKPIGDDSKKSTEWVLEEFAIKEGVQSTTRYRKGTGAKKFMKSDTPAPSRQSSGRKGGISASKTKFQRQRVRETDPQRSVQRHDILRSQFPAQFSQRQKSPLTPPILESAPPSASSPYFFKAETQPYDVPYEDVCGMEDVQGVFLDDSPLFANNNNGQYHDGLPRY